jgi:hypothetical protein
MAEPKKNALKSVVVWLNDIFKILATQLQDVEAKKEALRALGLNPAGANQPVALPAGSLASIQQFVDKSDDDIDIEAFASVVLDVISVSQAIESFVHVVTDAEDPDIVNDFLDMLLQLYLMDAVRLRSGTGEAKVFYQISQAMGFYQELAAPAGGLFGLTKNIAGFIERLINSFGKAEDAAQAAMIMDVVFIALAAATAIPRAVRDRVKVVYGFDAPSGSPSPSPNADLISSRTLTAQLSYKLVDNVGVETTANLLTSLTVRPQNEQGCGIEVLFGGGGKIEKKFGDWKFSVNVTGTGDDLRNKIKVEHDGEQAPLVVGDTQGTNLTIGAASFEVTASAAEQNLDFKLNTTQGGFVLKKSKKSDGFINSILPENPIFGAFDLGIGYSLKKGLYVDGGSGLTVMVPLHASLGPLTLNSFFLKLAGNTTGDGVLIETAIGLSTKFLGFAAAVERIGLTHNLSLPADGRKNLGFINYEIGFKPPNGVGLSLDVGLLKGGGFLYLDPEKGEYFGGLELSFQGLFTLKAIGIINTKMPDGSEGFSMLVIITAEFQPIQLGFGFTLNGVGGLLGLHRTARIEALREGIKTNALKSILFPEDIVANMSRIISDLRQVFPPLQDRFLIGPMAKLGWGTPSLLTLELGLLLEIPVPRVAILGVLKAVLPVEEAALLRLQVNFLGVIDFDNQYISFDASLYDSRLLIFVLTGDMAFRLNWGAQPMFLLSVGGFHPAFKDAPGDLQNMTRLTISLLSGENPRISVEAYFAVTSNTAQFGAKVELYAAAAGFNVYGFLGFDVLFRFEPFSFVAALAAGLALRRGSNVIMGLRLSGQLSGPTPWDARGEASFSILFFDVTVGFHETWGDEPASIPSETEDLIQRLKAEINDDRNWKAELPKASSLHVSIKELKPAPNQTVVHPFGVLTFSERLVPLEVSIEKFGVKRPKDANRFTIAPSDNAVRSDPVSELFAPGNFLNLTDDEKLARPSFETMRSGFRMTGAGALQVPAMVSKSVDYEMSYVRKKRGIGVFAGIYKYARALFQENLRASAVAKSSLSFSSQRPSVNRPDEVNLATEGFAIVSTSDMKFFGPEGMVGSHTEASQQMAELLARQPSLAGQIQVVSTVELLAA